MNWWTNKTFFKKYTRRCFWEEMFEDIRADIRIYKSQTNDTKTNNGSISTTEKTRNSSFPAKKAVPASLATPFVLLLNNKNIIWNVNRFEHQYMNKSLGVIQTKHQFLHRDFSSQHNIELKRMQSEKWTARPPLNTVGHRFNTSLNLSWVHRRILADFPVNWFYVSVFSICELFFFVVLSLSIYYGVWSRLGTFLWLLWTEIADYLYYYRNKIEGS